MRLPDEYDDEKIAGLPVFYTVVGVSCFILLLLGIVLFTNYDKFFKPEKNKTEESTQIPSAEQELEEAEMIQETEPLISGSKLTSDDLDFWDMYPKEETEETVVTEETEEETKPDPATDGKHTLVVDRFGEEEWVTINPYLRKNSYDYTNLVSQSGLMKYYEGSRVTSYLGVDLSKTEGIVDFNKLKKAGVQFVMLRVGARGYGSGQLIIDDYFAEHIKGASDAGLQIGLYFSSAAITVEEAMEEAAFLLALIGEYKVTYPIAFDMGFVDNDTSRIEELSKEQKTEITRAFLEMIKTAGYTPMIYGNKEWLIKQLDLAALSEYDFWLSNQADLPDYPYSFSIWQYDTAASIDGIAGNARLNISFIDYSEK